MNSLLLACLLAPDVTPERTVQAFVNAFNARDLAAMGRQVIGAKGGAFPVDAKMFSLKANVGVAKIEGDDATVDVDTELPDPHGTSKFHETVHLRRIEGDWRIVPLPSMEGAKTPQPIGIFALFTTKPEMFFQAKKATKKTVDLSNVKQVALATIMYAADHNDRLPLATSFKASIMPYLRNAEVLTAPDAPKGTVSYFLDPRLSGVLTTSIARPAETAMILEGTPKQTAFPWEGKTSLGYVDGHVKPVDRTAVLRARTIALK